VKIFVGLGLPWTIKGLTSDSVAAAKLGQGLGVLIGGLPTADISLAVVMLAIISVLVIGTLQVRRTLFDGELGGSGCSRAVTACFMILLWIIFILVSFCNCFEYIKTRDVFMPTYTSISGIQVPGPDGERGPPIVRSSRTSLLTGTEYGEFLEEERSTGQGRTPIPEPIDGIRGSGWGKLGRSGDYISAVRISWELEPPVQNL
jgi:hypothetical protein